MLTAQRPIGVLDLIRYLQLRLIIHLFHRQPERPCSIFVPVNLLRPKGLRSLSPKSGGYNPIFAGPPQQRDRCYYQGTAWPWLMGFYLEAYLRVYKRSGLSYIERQLIGFDEEMSYHFIGTLPELFDGDPPFHGRGAFAFAMSVSGILRAERLLEKYNENNPYKEETI